jgi:hypothetical protein
MSTTSYAAAPKGVLEEIIREAEARLEAQLTAAVAADQRAMTFAGLMLAAAGAMIGAALGASPDGPLTASVFVTALGLFISAVLAVLAARPVVWNFVGNTPASWLKGLNEDTSLKVSLAQMADFYAEMIEENETAFSGAAFWIRLSMGSALASLLLGLIFAAVRTL